MDRLLFVAALAALFLFGLLDNARGPLLPAVLGALDLSDTGGSTMFSASSLGVIASMIGGPALVRRLGTLACLRLALATQVLALLAYAAVRGLPGLVLASIGFGVALGGLALSANLLVEQGAGAGRRRAGLGVLHATYGLASLAAPLAVGGARAAGLDWRATFGAAAALPLVAALGALALRRPVEARAVEAGPKTPGLPARAELTLGLMLGFAVVAEVTISTRLVLLLRRAGEDATRAELALTAFFVALLVGRLGAAAVPPRWGARRLLALSAGASAALAALALSVEPLLLVGLGLTCAPFFPVTMELLAERFPERVEGAFASAHLIVSLLLVLSHLAVGALSDALGLRAACAVVPLALVAALGLLGMDGRNR